MGSKDADAFEKACEKHVFAEALAKAKARGELAEADYAKAVHSVLLEKTTMFSPEILLNAGVRMHTLSCHMNLMRLPVALAPPVSALLWLIPDFSPGSPSHLTEVWHTCCSLMLSLNPLSS